MTPVAAPPDAAVAARASSRRWTLVAAVLGSSLAFVDGTVVNVALPAMQRELNASAADAQWIVESYALLLAALLLVGGALGDRFGRRRIFMLGVAIFTLASIGCALSGSVMQLILTRAVQGVGAALLVPGSLALLSAAYPKAERGAAIGTWSAFSGITAAVGPVVGGFLVEHFSWTWAFLVNVPLGIGLLAISAKHVAESSGSAAHDPVDVSGATLATLGLAGIVFAFIEAPGRGWISWPVISAMTIGMLGLAAFLAFEARARSPMLQLALFREPNFAGANLLTLMLYAALGGGLYFFPLDLVQVQGYGATAAGAALLPFIAIMFALSRWTGALVDRYGAKLPLMIGPAIAALGFAGLGVPSIGDSYWMGFFPATCVLGLGMSVTVAPLTTMVMTSVGEGLAGVASGVNNAVSRVAGLLAIAVFGIVMALVFDAALGRSLATLPLAPDVLAAVIAQRTKLAAITLPDGMVDVSAVKHAIGMAFVSGFRWVMGISAALAGLGSAAAWWLIDGKSAAKSNG